MSGFERPYWLQAALSARSTPLRAEPLTGDPDVHRPAIGQVRVLQHMDLRTPADRLGLIVDVDEHLATASVLLVSPLVEYRTAVDYLVEPAASASRMPLVVECDLRGAVWFAQLGQRVGMCDAGLAAQLDAVGGGALPDDIGLSQAGFGLPARDKRDQRWAWKLAELDALNVLTHECDERLVDADERLPDGREGLNVVDPMLFTEFAEASPAPLGDLIGLLDLVAEAPVFMPVPALESLDALMSQSSPDVQLALLPLLQAGLSGASLGQIEGPAAEWSYERPGAIGDDALAQAIVASASPGSRYASLVTAEKVWAGNEGEGPVPPHIEVSGVSRIQIHLRFIDQEQREAA